MGMILIYRLTRSRCAANSAPHETKTGRRGFDPIQADFEKRPPLPIPPLPIPPLFSLFLILFLYAEIRARFKHLS